MKTVEKVWNVMSIEVEENKEEREKGVVGS